MSWTKSNKQRQNKRIRNEMARWFQQGYGLREYWNSYDGPRSYQSIRDLWQYMESEYDTEAALEETGQLLREVAERLSTAKNINGVEDWALASFCGMSEEDFCTMMAALGV